MHVELLKLVELQELNHVLDRRKCCSHDVFVLLSCTCPDGIDDMLLQWVLNINGSEIGQFKRALDQLTVRILNEDVLQDLCLRDPVGKVLEIEKSTYLNVAYLDFLFAITLAVFHFVEDFFELCHTADFLIKEGAHQVLLSNSKLIGFRDFVHISLWLMNFDESL